MGAFAFQIYGMTFLRLALRLRVGVRSLRVVVGAAGYALLDLEQILAGLLHFHQLLKLVSLLF